MKHVIPKLILSGFVLTTASASAEIESEIHAGYHGIYEFRGVDLGDDLYEGGIDLSYKLGSGFTLTGGVWYADSNGAGGAFEEVDYYVGLTKALGPVEVSAGYTYYDYPGKDAWKTDEVYLGLSHKMENGLSLALTYFRDIDDFQAGYLEFEASKSYPVCACASLDLAVGAAYSFGYNGDVDGGALHGFNHYYVKVGVPWKVWGNATLTPYIKFIGAGSDLANDYDDGGSSDLLYGGIALSYSF